MTDRPILLPLSSRDADVVLVALSELASYDGDDRWTKNHAKAAAGVIKKIRCVQHIETETSRQALLALGIGVARGRPQG